MRLRCIILMSLYVMVKCEERLTLLSKTHSARLEKYTGYVDTAILHFKVPDDTGFASFKFQAEEVALSLFRCKPHDITLYLKRGSPPVINPDGSKFPDEFLKYGRPQLHLLEFKSNSAYEYVNVTSPFAGSYFAAAFISYTDPKQEGITQQGLTPDCITFLNAALYVNQKPTPQIITTDKDLHVLLRPNSLRLYKFYVPEVADAAVLIIKDINFCKTCNQLLVKIQPHTIPAPSKALYDIDLQQTEYDSKGFVLRFVTLENTWYYVAFLFNATNENSTINVELGQFIFRVKPFSSYFNVTYSNETQDDSKVQAKTEAVKENGVAYRIRPNNSVLFKHSIMKSYQSTQLDYNVAYKQYNLVRDGHTESFMYSFDLRPDADGSTPLVVNVTDKEIFVLKFLLNPGLDIGGTLQFGLAFKPRIKTVGKVRVFEEEPENHTVIACIQNRDIDIPTWPNKCLNREDLSRAPIIINKTVDNNTLYIPYPEAGDWYISFKLFCGGCEPCTCSEGCKKEYRGCFKQCQKQCENTTSCDLCVDNCEQSVLEKADCTNCDCEGPCQTSKVSCNSSVVFVVASYPCVGGKCGSNGKCMYMVSEGLAYSVCICTNNYRGWNCGDSSQANSYGMIILELLLLVLSNLLFLPAVYVSYKREYYVEAIVYFSTCFFSTFYHACDAGENIYSFCLVRLSVLQFSDFFCGLLSIWVTVIAMAYLKPPWPSICHIVGAISLAFGTTVNKTSLWVFALPFLSGILILIISWYVQYRKTGTRFPSKRYLFVIFPGGLFAVGVGLLMYALLQTQSNYKYLHSMWHILMAVGIIILLPDKKTFLPPAINPID